MASLALGALAWSPSEFWAATPHDYYSAIEHYERAEARRKALADDA